MAVLEGGGERWERPLLTAEQWEKLCAHLRQMLTKPLDKGRCAAVTVAVHLADDGCDHEVGG